MNIEEAPMSENRMTYNEAILYCQFLEYNGYRDWRLPTEEEYVKSQSMNADIWYLDDLDRGPWCVTPVRDID